jgi:hypothetical protein
VSQNLDGTFDGPMNLAIKDAAKYALLAANLTWVCFNIPNATRNLVCVNEHLTEYMLPHIPEPNAATIGTLVQWIAEQPESLEEESSLMKDILIGMTDFGLKTYTEADSPRIYVPKQRR